MPGIGAVVSACQPRRARVRARGLMVGGEWIVDEEDSGGGLLVGGEEEGWSFVEGVARWVGCKM